MPTPKGLPKVGERVEYTDPDGVKHRGTVLARTAGTLWDLQIQWDSGKTRWLLTAGYYQKRGELKVI